ncbi:putative molybdenum carrier protein [Marinobacterium weihaiense]|uniref:Molybdenum carrier protein n=1 Tax=Marinobacterium weihaiense TaxID=2851016 RepID=A0ABS6M6V7_9GAMM|nr:putative molybdenum carrier protein [Marinobacterium weihaiense]MBV0932026.1 putative molybdenum carrier protein [Marinobacterium weihaiense]
MRSFSGKRERLVYPGLQKIISGGQTGADRAGLDAAMVAGMAVGGHCPAGRAAEDGVIPGRYPLTEIEAGYRQRTRLNVEAADANCIIYHGMPQGGTALALSSCLKKGKPFKLIDMSMITHESAAVSLLEFVCDNRVGCLNVAGPREGRCPGVYDYVFMLVARMIELVTELGESPEY